MIDTITVDDFLALTVRDLRKGAQAVWARDSSRYVDDLWARIDFHGIAPFLHDKADQLSAWPESLRSRIAEEARLLGLWEVTHHELVAKLLEGLSEAGIPNLLMKGTVLAYSLYPKPEMRRRGDSDLMIHPKDLTRVREVLENSGWYRAKDPHGLYFQEGWLRDTAGFFTHALDLHWEASERPVLQRLLPRPDFFDRRRPLPKFSDYAFGTDPAHTMMHCAINQAWHVDYGYWVDDEKICGARRLIWSLDFDLLASSATSQDWTLLVDFCKKQGAGPLVADALRGAERDLHSKLPSDVIAELESHSLHPDVARCLAVSNRFDEFWHDLRTASSWRNRRRMILTRALPPRSHLLDKYPDKAAWPTALLRVRLLLETAGRAFRRVFAT